ncbi:MAG TPA: tetrahydrofolate dehydrogenase/cyclohydrolase catalytic domain-containing protein, partial [Patescibacteria group bacterium]|nr:tetrahydrofolate dehydrogenase/cyclohydrolase catalytic domain-containing protein [Patescibacteria group bacterium]
MKYLNGSDLAGYIKERQARHVANLNKKGVNPKLAIIVTIDDPVIEVYLRLKKKYGTDIGIEVTLFRVDIKEVKNKIKELNLNKEYTGIIVQLPIAKPDLTDEIANLVKPSKDVDGLSNKTKFHPATPLAIQWLLSGYNVDLNGKEIVLVGKGRLVGGPL